MQFIAKKEILVVVALLVVHCYAINIDVIVASHLYDVADVQFTRLQTRAAVQPM